jgi:hypothetical protein
LELNSNTNSKKALNKIFGSGGRRSPSNANLPKIGDISNINNQNQSTRNILNNSMTPCVYKSQDKSFGFGGDTSLNTSMQQPMRTIEPIMLKNMNTSSENGGDTNFNSRRALSYHQVAPYETPKDKMKIPVDSSKQHRFSTTFKEVNIN